MNVIGNSYTGRLRGDTKKLLGELLTPGEVKITQPRIYLFIYGCVGLIATLLLVAASGATL